MNSFYKTAFYYRLFDYNYDTDNDDVNGDDEWGLYDDAADVDNGNRSFISLLKCASLPLRKRTSLRWWWNESNM